jgi:DDE superfamily endonuclease
MRAASVLFLDETAVRLSEAPTHTLVAPGEQEYVLATETSSYSKRFDMIACVSRERTFAPCIYSPSERKQEGARGVNTEMLQNYILSTLGQETAALDNPPLTLVLDKASIHSEEKILEAFRERGGHVTEIMRMPPNAAKRMSPLDNALFHDWKEAVRRRCPLTLRSIQQVMADEWNNITAEQIRPHFEHCGLTPHSDVYADCPHPSIHTHHKAKQK